MPRGKKRLGSAVAAAPAPKQQSLVVHALRKDEVEKRNAELAKQQESKKAAAAAEQKRFGLRIEET